MSYWGVVIHICIHVPLRADVCENHQCRNGGNCVRTKRGYKCECMGGFVGKHCDTGTGSALIDNRKVGRFDVT